MDKENVDYPDHYKSMHACSTQVTSVMSNSLGLCRL